jgi:hypothetical protein
MTKVYRMAGAVLTVALAISMATSLFGDPQTPRRTGKGTVIPDVRPEDYSRVLDAVFSNVAESPSRAVFTIRVRFRPTSEPEAQLVLRQERGATGVVEYLQADRSIHSAINEMLEANPGASAESVKGRIRVQRRSITLPAVRLFEIQAGLFASLDVTMADLASVGRSFYNSGSLEVTLDAESYDIVYEQGTTRLSAFFSASEADASVHPGRSGVGGWARSLRDEIARLVSSR